MAKVVVGTAQTPKDVKPGSRSLFYTIMLILLAIVVLYPLILLLINSFVVQMPGKSETISLENWIKAWQQPGMLESIINTFNRVFVTELIAMPIAIIFVWLLARTNIPWKGGLDFLLWVAFFLPTLPVLMGWILLLDPKFGLVNQMFVNWFGMEKGPFNVYSFWGIVWIHLVTKSVAAKYILMLPAFKNMDASLEEASQMSGYGKIGTIIHTVIPIMMPAILVSLIISLIHNLESFETEIVLGPPAKFYVFSTQIYQLIQRDNPLYGAATVLGVVILLSMVPLIFYQYWLSTKRKFTTVSSRFKPTLIRLGSMKWPAFSIVFLFGLLITVVPLVFLLMGTVMKLFGFFNIDQPWTFEHWHRVLSDSILIRSIWNTGKISSGVAIIGMLWFSLLAYISVRSKFKARGVVDFLSWVPASIPGILLSLGVLWMFLQTPVLRPMYGTIFILIIVLLITSMTTGVQLIKSNMLQLHEELEEASAVSGGSWFYTYRKVLLPILAPALLSVGIIAFITASRSVSQIAMLVTGKNRPVSMLQLDYMVDGNYEAAAISGVIIVLLTIGVAIIARTIGKKLGVKV